MNELDSSSWVQKCLFLHLPLSKGTIRLIRIGKGHPVPTDAPEVIGERVLQHLMRYFSSGPVLAMVWEGAHAVSIVRKVTGGTEPRTSDVGTIRGDFMLDSYEMSETDGRSIRNLVHASGSVSDAQAEIAHWFAPHELFEYRIIQEQVLYEEDMGILNIK
jgi:nucleoside diphosphate kinase